jgi:diguanylate cyclase (GGDEF)-like protein
MISAPVDRQTILVVDDEAINIKIIEDALKDQYRVLFAMNGEEALNIAREDAQPDLILLDVVMPNMGGYEVCKKLKSNPLTQYIPVIFITSLENEIDETRGFEVGAVDFIRKPLRKAIVMARIKLHLELKNQMDFHARRSLIDGLTEIANRRRLMEHLSLELRRAIRNQKYLSVIMIDIDFFKLFNDNYGHISGDECLKIVAENVHSRMKRPNDLVGRYGGEEFVCILPDTDFDGAEGMCQLLLDSIRQLEVPHNYSKVSDILTISIGCVSTIPLNNTCMEDLLKAADDALYESKHSGRNCYTCSQLEEK